ncbi:MAG: type II toxin-antitoxin system VapC family toxin [Lacipirellulaceae bacterium]
MIAIDTNVLVYAHREESPFHVEAAARLAELVGTGEAWAIPWPCVHEFLATVTNPRKFVLPTPTSVALDAIAAWVEQPAVRLIGERADHFEVLARLLTVAKTGGGRVHDARVAAICLSHGVSMLWTADRDFALFPPLRCENPLLQA